MENIYWKAEGAENEVQCLCLGTGRFLRAVLVPALNHADLSSALIQTRGSSFYKYMKSRSKESSYQVDTVQVSGDITTQNVLCFGGFTLGSADGQNATWEFVNSLSHSVQIIGMGVTEAGLASANTPAMKSLMDLLKVLATKRRDAGNKICIIDMDNVPNNGDTIRSHLLNAAKREDDSIRLFIENFTVCLNTMVDRITSARPGSDGMVPRGEPLPAKALVILDPDGDLPAAFRDSSMATCGVIVRSTKQQLDADVALKLRIANGTHTAVAHALALQKLLLTDHLASPSANNLWMESYLESLVQHQIFAAAIPLFGEEETEAAWKDWKGRLIHPHFGLSSFFITQNGAAKAGIRWGPTIVELISNDKPITVAMVFAYSALVRWLTPKHESKNNGEVFIGWLDSTSPSVGVEEEDKAVSYADGLRYNLGAGWYEFKCACEVRGKPVSTWLQEIAGSQPTAYCDVIREYMVTSSGGDLHDVASMPAFDTFVYAVATVVARMVVGDSTWQLMQEIQNREGIYVDGFETNCVALVDAHLPLRCTLQYKTTPIPSDSCLMDAVVSREAIASVVCSEVASAEVVDLHTHLLPPTHGALCLWGIDELLTYHYLVAEYFMTSPAEVSPEKFYSMDKQSQADLIWNALFIDRSPVSEACRGVLTTLIALGMQECVQSRDLEAIRRCYASYRDRGLEGAEEFSERIYKTSGVRYAIMTNIPFDMNEATYWKPNRANYSKRYRSALRVDPLLSGDYKTIEASLAASGYPLTLEGAKEYLREWCDVMNPEYMMASTPHDFVFEEGTLAGFVNDGVNKEAMKLPGAFADVSVATAACDPQQEDSPTLIDENSDFLSKVLMQVCEERDLPVALKIGAHRGVNSTLRSAGDGVVAFADAGVLARLCARFPKVRFLATFLSRNNQHEACVLASKFRNLHIYGCWWSCNNPSIIREITQMRVEMLGTAFTAQHSDARVLDQLLYKWSHSRAVIASVLREEYSKLSETGWRATRAEIRRDVDRLFGRSYEEFMAKSFT